MPIQSRAFCNHDRIMRLAQFKRELGQRTCLGTAQAFGQMGHKAFRQIPLAGLM